MCFPLVVGVRCLCLFCCAFFCVLSSFAIVLKRKRELVALLLLSYGCLGTVSVLRLLLTMPWVGLSDVIVVFPHHTYFIIAKNNGFDSPRESARSILSGVDKYFCVSNLFSNPINCNSVKTVRLRRHRFGFPKTSEPGGDLVRM